VSTELTPWVAPTFGDCIREAKALKEDDVLGACRLIKTAAAMGVDDLEAEVLLKEISKSTGLRMTSLRNAMGERANQSEG
jgi:hypothetical protein